MCGEGSVCDGSPEVMKILGMLEDGKITAGEAAELLRALGGVHQGSQTGRLEVKLVRDKEGIKVLRVEGSSADMQRLKEVLPKNLRDLLGSPEDEEGGQA